MSHVKRRCFFFKNTLLVGAVERRKKTQVDGLPKFLVKRTLKTTAAVKRKAPADAGTRTTQDGHLQPKLEETVEVGPGQDAHSHPQVVLPSSTYWTQRDVAKLQWRSDVVDYPP